MSRLTPSRYFLPANFGTETPATLIFVDTETQELSHPTHARKKKLKFRLGVACKVRLEACEATREDWFTFSTTEQFWGWHAKQQADRRPVWLFAHNLVFDLTILDFWRRLDARDYLVSTAVKLPGDRDWKSQKPFTGMIVVDGRPNFMRLLGRKGTCWFVDSLNYFPERLKSYAESVDCPAMEWPGNICTDEVLQFYCRNDVEIVKRLMLQLIGAWKRWDCGIFRPTAAGLALQNFQHWHADDREPRGDGRTRYNVSIDRKHRGIDLEREGYMGGRVEAFYLGDVPERRSYSPHDDEGRLLPYGPLYHVDVRSCYPFVMRNGLYPIDRVHHWTSPELGRVEGLMPAFGVLARVSIDSPMDTYPMKATDMRQLFIKGQFDTVLCGAELERAFRLGHVAKVHECIVYKTRPIFREWIDFWWSRRLEAEKKGDTPTAAFARLLMNSLSGKFAQNPTRWTDKVGATCMKRWGEWSVRDGDTGTAEQWRAIGGNPQCREKGEEARHSFPAISAFITSAAREYMRSLIDMCPECSVLYIATDALIVTRRAWRALQKADMIRPYDLGGLARKGYHQTGRIGGQNSYRLDEKWQEAGLWGKAKPAGENRYTATLFAQAKTILSEMPDGTIEIEEVDLEQRTVRPKGKTSAGGWLSPWNAGEIPELLADIPILRRTPTIDSPG